MTPKEFRAAVFSEINVWATANYPSMQVLFENGPTPDEATMGAIWLDVELRWYGGSVAAMGTNPRMRQTGAVSVMCFYRTGEGTAAPDDVVDGLSAHLQARRMGAGVLDAAQRTVPTNLRGWFKTGLLIPFTLG